MWLLLIVVILLFFFMNQSKEGEKALDTTVRKFSLRAKPWLISPWNQSTIGMAKDDEFQRGFEIAPHSWDVKNDPTYYRWYMHHRIGKHLPENE
jgi:hypothetical protein